MTLTVHLSLTVHFTSEARDSSGLVTFDLLAFKWHQSAMGTSTT